MSLNPYGRVPTLEEDGFVLFESTAILNYLEATRPHGPSELKPSKAIARTLLLSWCRCVAAKAAQDRGHIDRKLMGGHRTERACARACRYNRARQRTCLPEFSRHFLLPARDRMSKPLGLALRPSPGSMMAVYKTPSVSPIKSHARTFIAAEHPSQLK